MVLRRLIACLVLILPVAQVRIPGPGGKPAGAGPNIVLQQSNHSTGTTGVTSKSVAFNSAVGNGQLIRVAFNFGNNASGVTYSASDDKTGGSNTYSACLNNEFTQAGLNDLGCFVAVNAASGQALTVTVSCTPTGTCGTHTLRVAIYAYSSGTGWPADPRDKGNGVSVPTTTSIGSTTFVSPTNTGSLLTSDFQTDGVVTSISVGGGTAGCAEQTAGGTAGSGWLSDGRADSADSANIGTGNSTCPFSWTTSRSATFIVNNFKPN